MWITLAAVQLFSIRLPEFLAMAVISLCAVEQAMQRLDALRLLMADAHLDGYLIPMADPFQSEYVAKLRSQFDHLALFFFNQLEGTEVGIVWKPNSFSPRNFSALHSLHRTFVHEKSMATINVPNLVSEMVCMGNGLVERVIIR